ncbi:MAG: amidohydrolase [Chlorobi bacterium]|nr:amidohydrolase [Chlorobiota bacterium]
MDSRLTVTYLQQDIIWEDTEANLKKLDAIVDKVSSNTDLFILPEMFHAGFTMRPEKIAESGDGKVIRWMKDTAANNGFAIMGSVIIYDDDAFYNRLSLVHPDGRTDYYDKRHLFSIGGENENYRPGNRRVVMEVNGWRILPLICYDLRFPVWSRNRNDYDLLVYVANWPEPRREVWQTLLKARALENQSYVIGVNRVGEDKTTSYAGDSKVLDFKGKTISEAEENKEGLVTSVLSLDELKAFRKKFPAWKDADGYILLGVDY